MTPRAPRRARARASACALLGAHPRAAPPLAAHPLAAHPLAALPRARSAARAADAGLTLVEMLVALALFAVIATTAFTVLREILHVQAATEGRLDRLARIERTSYVLTRDFLQTAGGSLVAGGEGVAFRRSGGSGELAVRYVLEGSSLMREVSEGPGRGVVRQTLLPGVLGVDWRFYDPHGGWRSDWPPPPEPGPTPESTSEPAPGAASAPMRPPGNPAAVAVELTLAGPGLSGGLRRILPLPAEAAP